VSLPFASLLLLLVASGCSKPAPAPATDDAGVSLAVRAAAAEERAKTEAKTHEWDDVPGITSWVDEATGLRAAGLNGPTGRVWFRVGDQFFSTPTVSDGLRLYPTGRLATPKEIEQRVKERAANK
jgi:hypothetical protein